MPSFAAVGAVLRAAILVLAHRVTVAVGNLNRAILVFIVSVAVAAFVLLVAIV